MNITVTRCDGALVARVLEARLDAASVWRLPRAIARAIDGAGTRVVLDLSHVEFVDSAGLGGILAVLRKLGPEGRLALAGCRAQVREVLRLTRLDRILPLADSVDAALAAAV